MDDLYIRDASESERETLTELTLAAYEEYAAGMPPAAFLDYRESIRGTLADVGPAEQIVAEGGGEIVGTALLYPAGARLPRPEGDAVTLAWPEMRLLAVSPAARGRGVGSALVRECVRRARAAGADAITLHTTDFMRAAMGMYERMGFARAPELDFQPAPEVLVKGFRLPLRPENG